MLVLSFCFVAFCLFSAAAFTKRFEGTNIFANQRHISRSRIFMADVELVFPGNKKTKASSGSKLKDAAAKAKYNAPYGCEEGKCGSCEHTVNGKKIRLCIGKVPAGPGPLVFKQ